MIRTKPGLNKAMSIILKPTSDHSSHLRDDFSLKKVENIHQKQPIEQVHIEQQDITRNETIQYYCSRRTIKLVRRSIHINHTMGEAEPSIVILDYASSKVVRKISSTLITQLMFSALSHSAYKGVKTPH